MFDTISGIKQNDGYKEGRAPAYVRYASDVRITVQMDPGSEERIRKPLVEISYREYSTDLVTENTQTHASFKFEYYEDGASFEDAAEIVLYVFNALVLLVVAIRMYFWIQLNPPRFFAKQFAVAFGWRFLFYVTDVWSNIMFLVYFIITMYWFIMYKLQANAYILMPQTDIPDSTYDTFFIFLCAIIAAKTVAVLMAIIDQTNVDIFVMDWERYEQMKLIEVKDTT